MKDAMEGIRVSMRKEDRGAMYRAKAAAAAIFLLMGLVGLAWAAIPVKVPLGKGTVLTLKDPAKRISLANDEIADVHLISPKEILINGKKEGSTNVIIWDAAGNKEFFDIIVVRQQADYDEATVQIVQKAIAEAADDADVKVEKVGDTIVLKGTAKNRLTVDKIEKLALLYAPNGCQGVSRDFSLESSLPKAEDNVSTTELRGGGAFPYKVVATNPTPALVIREKEEKNTPEAKGTLCVLDLITIPEPQQVLLEVKVAQVDRSALKGLGISFLAKGRTAEGFSNLIGAPQSGQNSAGATSQSGIGGNAPGIGSFNPLDTFQLGASYFPGGIGAVLKALTTKNLAKVLAEPNLLVKSGEKGEFLAGSKIPVSVVSSLGTADIQFIPVGIQLIFKPYVMEDGKISLKIDPAMVSSLTGTLAVNGYPIIDTREVRTGVELGEGESLILAGLLQNETIKTMSKIPLLGDIPILGALFRSTQDDLKEKELVFFITPRLVKPTEKGVKTELPTDKPVPRELDHDLRWIPLGK